MGLRSPNSWLQNREFIILDYPGGPSVIIRILKVEEGSNRRESEGDGTGEDGQRDASLLVLKMKGQGHQAKYVGGGGLWELE